MIQVWIIRDDCKAFAVKLERALAENPKFRGSLICTDEGKKSELVKVADTEKLQNVDLAILLAANRDSGMKQFRLSPEAKNTIHVYKNKKVAATFVDISEGDFAKVVEAAKAL